MNIKKLLSTSALVFLSATHAFCTEQVPAALDDPAMIGQVPVSSGVENDLAASDASVFPFMELPTDLRKVLYSGYFTAGDLRKLSHTSKSAGQDIRAASQLSMALMNKIDSMVLVLRPTAQMKDRITNPTNSLIRHKSRYTGYIEILSNPLGLVSGVKLEGNNIFEKSDLCLLSAQLEMLLNNEHIKRVILINAVFPDSVEFEKKLLQYVYGEEAPLIATKASQNGNLRSLTILGSKISEEMASAIAAHENLKYLKIAGCLIEPAALHTLRNSKFIKMTHFMDDLKAAIFRMSVNPCIENIFVETVFRLREKNEIGPREARSILTYVKEQLQGDQLQNYLDTTNQNKRHRTVPLSKMYYIAGRAHHDIAILNGLLNQIDIQLDAENEMLRQIFDQESKPIKVLCRTRTLKGQMVEEPLSLKDGMLVSELLGQLNTDNNSLRQMGIKLIFAGKCFFDSRRYRSIDTERITIPQDLRLKDGSTIHVVYNSRVGILMPEFTNPSIDKE